MWKWKVELWTLEAGEKGNFCVGNNKADKAEKLLDKVEQSSKNSNKASNPVNQAVSQSVIKGDDDTFKKKAPSLKLNIFKGGDDGNSAANVLQAARLIPRALDDEGLAAGLDGRRGFCKE